MDPLTDRRQAAVLFVDIAGYSELCARVDPEAVHGILERFFEAADAIVGECGGHVVDHAGDAVVAAFGAPRAHADDAERAVRAALEIHAAASRLADPRGGALRVHAGLCGGEVVAGPIVSAAGAKYSVTGEPVNLAARICAVAPPGGTLVSESLRRPLAEHYVLAPAGEHALKGREEPLALWAVQAARLVGPKPPFVGREHELTRALAALQDAIDSRASVAIAVRGDAGVGKSAVVERLTAQAAPRGCRVLAARFVDFPFNERDPLAALLSEEQAPSAAERRLLQQLDHPARLRRRAEALAAALAAGGAPLVLVLEDLHWADADALAVIAGAMQASRALGALFVWTARPLGEAEPMLAPLAAALPTVPLELPPLRPADAEALARRLGETDAAFIVQCVARAAGNPLFLVHLLQAGRTREDGVPGNLGSVVLARSDRLPADERGALQAAAVLGPVFRADELAELLGVPRAPLEASLRAGLVRRRERLYEFSHVLVHEAIYGSLLRARRREFHSRAAARFCAADPLRRAQHLDRAESTEASAAYLEAGRAEWAEHGLEPALRLARRGLQLEPASPLREALLTLLAQVLLELGRTREAIAAFREVLAGAGPARERCAALVGLADALKTLGDYPPSLEALRDAERLAGEQALQGELGRIHGIRGNVYFAQFDVERCEGEHRASLQHAELAGNPEGIVRALNGLGDAAYARGRVQTAARWFADARNLAQRHGLARQEVAARALYGLCQLYLHRLPDGLEQVDAALELARRLHSVAAEVMVQCMRGTLLNNQGEHRELERMLETVLPKARAAQVRRFEAVLLRLSGLAALGLGERALALERLEAALRLARDGALRFIGASILGGIALAADDASRREQAVREGLELLALGSVSHCHFNFYRDAIDAFLVAGDPQRALDLAARLERYASDEPLPWCILHVRRTRALAALVREPRDPAARREAAALRAELDAAGLRGALPLVERFLQ